MGRKCLIFLHIRKLYEFLDGERILPSSGGKTMELLRLLLAWFGWGEAWLAKGSVSAMDGGVGIPPEKQGP